MPTTVNSLAELCARRFVGDVNALCWPRTLLGDFSEVARALAPSDGLITVDEDMLLALPLSVAGQQAAATMIADLHTLTALGRDPVLNCIKRYPHDERALAIRTDVMSFHVDSAPIEVDTWLCTYAGKSSEGLAPHDAVRKIDVPAHRAALLKQWGGDDDDAFVAWLKEHSFNLHYEARAGAVPIVFGTGHLWRIAVQWPGAPVPGCVHRAPHVSDDDPPRLLLIC